MTCGAGRGWVRFALLGAASQKLVSVVLLAGLAAVGRMPSAHAQTTEAFNADCAAAGGGSWCPLTAIAYRAAISGIGLAAAAGNEMPGSASTIGRHPALGSRVALNIRLTAARIPLPESSEVSLDRFPELRSMVSGVSVDGAVGVFDGIRTAPAYGGILSFDLVASAGFLRLSRRDGFRENTYALGIGGRLGILRESFGVPGISLSVVRRFFAETGLGSEAAPTAFRVDGAGTSVRALLGKELSWIGVTAGAGWDRYTGTVTLGSETTGSGQPEPVRLKGAAVDRLLVFAGLSRTWVVAQLTAELGWASGPGRIPERTPPPFDPGAGSFFGSLSVRVLR